MAEDWSREEVEATVADYFDMLGEELRGREYNKSAHRRRLASFLDARTEGAIERKHQNISAILIELGFVYVAGYKPLQNYQRLLFEAVSDRLARSEPLTELVHRQVSEPAQVPNVDDILATLVDPPMPDPNRDRYRRMSARETKPIRLGVDYLAMEAGNRSLGAAGEEFYFSVRNCQIDPRRKRTLSLQGRTHFANPWRRPRLRRTLIRGLWAGAIH